MPQVERTSERQPQQLVNRLLFRRGGGSFKCFPCKDRQSEFQLFPQIALAIEIIRGSYLKYAKVEFVCFPFFLGVYAGTIFAQSSIRIRKFNRSVAVLVHGLTVTVSFS